MDQMDEINNLKKKIYNGEDIANNYSKLINLTNTRKKFLEKIVTRLKKKIDSEIECDDEKEIETDVLKLSKLKKINNEYITLYRAILSKINYLENFYNNNITIIKKIDKNNNKITFKKVK